MYDSTSHIAPGYRFQYHVPPKSPPFSMILMSSMPASRRPSAGEQAAETTADDDDLDLVVQRITRQRLDIRVVDVAREVADHLDVLLVAVGAQPLVALDAVLLAQRIGIEGELGDGRVGELVGGRHGHRCSRSCPSRDVPERSASTMMPWCDRRRVLVNTGE